MSVRLRVFYAGRVQGVGFRMKARRLASGFAVAGFVKNLEDGRVELVVEGQPPDVTSFLGAIRDEFGTMIQDVEERPEKPDPAPLSGFAIRH